MAQRNGEPRFFYGWVVVGVATLIMNVCFGIQYSFGIFFKSFIEEFGWTRAATSGIFSLYMVTRGVLSVVMGYFSDRWGPRWTVAIGGTSIGLGLLFISKANAIWQLYIFYSMMGGLGAASFYVPLSSTLSRWFIKKRGLVFGIFTSGVGMGAIIFSPLVGFLISVFNWRTSYIILGMITLVIILSGALLLRHSPEAMGLQPDGTKGGDVLEKELDHREDQPQSLSLGKAFQTIPFWLILITEVINYMATITPLIHIVAYASDAGISPMASANILAAIGGFSIVGRLAIGGISDRVGAKKLLPMMLFMEGMMLFFLTLSKDATMFYIFAIVFGFAYGGSVPLIPIITANYFGLGSMGAIFGVISFAGLLGGGFGPLMAGYIYDVTKRYSIAFLTVGVLAVGGAILSLYLIKFKPIQTHSQNA